MTSLPALSHGECITAESFEDESYMCGMNLSFALATYQMGAHPLNTDNMYDADDYDELTNVSASDYTKDYICT